MSDYKEVPLLGTDKHTLIAALTACGHKAVEMTAPVHKIEDGPIIAAMLRKYDADVQTVLQLVRFVTLPFQDLFGECKFWIMATDHDNRYVRFAVSDHAGKDITKMAIPEKLEAAQATKRLDKATKSLKTTMSNSIDELFIARAEREARRVFYVDVAAATPAEAEEALAQIKHEMSKRGIEKQVVAFLNESDNKFTDISSESSRSYNFGQKGFVKIQNPLYLAVSSSGGHRIFSADGQSHYIPQGWIHLSWTVHEGQPNFVA